MIAISVVEQRLTYQILFLLSYWHGALITVCDIISPTEQVCNMFDIWITRIPLTVYLDGQHVRLAHTTNFGSKTSCVRHQPAQQSTSKAKQIDIAGAQ